MAKFNRPATGIKTENLAGGEAYKLNPKLGFLTFILTSFVKDQFYRSEQEGINQIKSIITNLVDKKFIAKGAIFARNEFGMRSITHIVAAELANQVKGENWTKGFYNKVIHRVDDITEIVSYYLANYGKPIPNSLRKGLKKAFDKFDDYQIAKYRAENKAVKLIDVVNLIRPKATTKNKIALEKLVKDELKSTETWEAKLTQAGQKAQDEDKKADLKEQAWKELLLEKKLGYFALLRNLRNILEQSPEFLDEALTQLVDEKAIKKSLVFPFRFTTAYNEINNSKVKKAINKAVEISLNNIPKFEGKTLIALDTSGSMEGRCGEIGSLFAMALVKTNDCDFMTMDYDAIYRSINIDDTLITLTKSVKYPGGITNFRAIFQRANKIYDRIVILSDMQGWVDYYSPQGDFDNYKRRFNCDPYVYSFDLQGYGTSQVIGNKVFCLAGFSDKVFDIMKLFEQNKNALIKTIEAVEL